ncbi:MAG: hypothetical protein ACU833_02985 [Gammaproteobacteria bacterium]
MTKLQMEDFDEKFAFVVDKDFTLLFHDPLIDSKDLLNLAKIQPTTKESLSGDKLWRYTFRKVDVDNHLIEPEVNFHWDLTFNDKNRLKAWTLSPKFIKMAPPLFLEIYLRSLADAEIDSLSNQVKVDTDSLGKIMADLPKRDEIQSTLGEPLKFYKKRNQKTWVDVYRFLLDSPKIEEGYESRAITTVKLSFDEKTNELVSMSGRYAGLKIKINYRKLIEEQGKKKL